MVEGSISVNVGVLSNALAVAIQQAASSGQSQSPQVPTSGANQSAIQECSDRSVTYKLSTVCYVYSHIGL